jgi:hypothetical protein
MTNDMRGIDCPPARAARSGVRASALAAFMMPLLTIALQPLAAQPVKVCSGTISASPLRPVAKPLVVELEHPIGSVANPGPAKAFLDGVQNAGATVVSKGQGTTKLDLSFLMRSARGKTGTYRSLSWMRSQQAPGDIQSVLRGSHVEVTIYAHAASSRALIWTGTISCTIQTDDVPTLAEGLGEIVGRSLGQTVPKAAL